MVDSQEDIVCISTKDSFYSDDWKEVLVSESEYYTNDILLRSTYILLSQPVSVELKTKF